MTNDIDRKHKQHTNTISNDKKSVILPTILPLREKKISKK